MVHVSRAALACSLVLLAACVPLLGLDETTLDADADRDLDGVRDRNDNCRDIPNADQRDTDGDGLGDTCDSCAQTFDDGHDEDADTFGDVCDVCPATPDFNDDNDGDGVGDLCDPDGAASTGRRYFTPFVVLDTPFEHAAPWNELGDAVAPADTLSASDPGLRAPSLAVGGPRWRFELRAKTSIPWGTAGRFELAAIDEATGAPRVACRVSGTGIGAEAVIVTPGTPPQPSGFVAVPGSRLALVMIAQADATTRKVTCAIGPSTVSIVMPASAERWWPSIASSPAIELTAFEVLE